MLSRAVSSPEETYSIRGAMVLHLIVGWEALLEASHERTRRGSHNCKYKTEARVHQSYTNKTGAQGAAKS